MNVLRTIFRWLVGMTFIFSGFVKLIDPMGYSYKITDYLAAMHLDAISDFALPLAVIVSVIELVVGLSLFFNMLPKLGSLGALLFMIFFTPLTLWLAIANPVSDCGCFGDALVITNWQTFYKNVILLIMSIFIFVQRKKLTTSFPVAWQWTIMTILGFTALGLSLYCLRNIPIIDFRPYHIGANITEGMAIPEDAPKPIVNSTFIYEKDGKQTSFTVDNLPDSTWKFVDAKHEIVDKGYEPPIHDFTMESTFYEEQPEIDPYEMEFEYSQNGTNSYFDITSLPDTSWTFVSCTSESYEGKIDLDKIKVTYKSADGNIITLAADSVPDRNVYEFYGAEYEMPESSPKDITSKVLADENYSFLMVALKLQDAKTKNLDRFNEIAKYCKENGYGFYCMTASNEEEITEFIKKYNPEYKFYNTDPITLKTIVRSNPGLLLIRKGTIIDKWSQRDLPEVSELKNELSATMMTKQVDNRDNLMIITWILGLMLFMAVVKIIYDWMVRNKYINK